MNPEANTETVKVRAAKSPVTIGGTCVQYRSNSG